MTLRFDPFADRWPAEASSETQAALSRERTGRALTQIQERAAATTEVARAATDATTRERNEQVARLRAQRALRDETAAEELRAAAAARPAPRRRAAKAAP